MAQRVNSGNPGGRSYSFSLIPFLSWCVSVVHLPCKNLCLKNRGAEQILSAPCLGISGALARPYPCGLRFWCEGERAREASKRGKLERRRSLGRSIISVRKRRRRGGGRRRVGRWRASTSCLISVSAGLLPDFLCVAVFVFPGCSLRRRRAARVSILGAVLNPHS
jgi:hypothetical protein